MQNSNVSVVMPAYNARAFIGKTIESLVQQTFDNWELIVVDDCSSDSTAEIVESFAKKDDRVRLVKLDKNFGGPAGPRNVGVKAAKYDLIAFLDSDDIWHPQKLQRQLELVEDPDNFFCCSAMTDFKDDGEIQINEIGNVSVITIGFKSQSLRAKIPTSSVVVSKSLMEKFPFNESPAYKAVEDFHCWLRILGFGVSCKKIKEPLLFYRKSEGQISGSKIKMMKKVFMVHREYEGRGIVSSFIFTLSHVVGGMYFRFIMKGM